MIATNAPTRPVCRYHGGKWKLAPWIISHFPEHRVYVEPFGGGGSVLLRKTRSYAEVYNDLDGEMVNLFRVARDSGQELTRRLALTPFARDEFHSAYESSDDPIEQARQTVVKSFLGFGSDAIQRCTGFRSNSNRSGTTPAHDWANLADAFPSIVQRLQGVVIENRAAVLVMLKHDAPDTLHYVDPPYVLSTRMLRTDSCRYRHELTDEDHRELAVSLKQLKGMVIVSGYPSTLYNELFEGWKRLDRDAFADGAAARIECLWISPNTPNGGLFA
jgi:DNA adenine methylase